MRSTSLALALALAAGVSAQSTGPVASASSAVQSSSAAPTASASTSASSSASASTSSSGPAQSVAKNGLALLSPSCQQTILQLARNGSEISTCLHADLLTSVITTNGSIIPPIDAYLEDFCAAEPCSNATLTNATSSLLQGCGSDLTNFGVTNQTVEWAVAQYPLARDVLCLKTSKPFSAKGAANGTANATESNNLAGNSTSSNSTSAGNSTSSNGTFCATSLLTELSFYLGNNLTVTDVITTALGGNQTALQTLQSIPPSALCNDCVFAAVSLVEEQYPQLGNLTVGNATFNDFLNGQCSANSTGSSTNGTSSTYQISANGTLPDSITESAYNSSLTNSTGSLNSTVPQTNVTFPTSLLSTAASVATSIKSATDVASATPSTTPNARALKARWVGA